MLRHFRLKRLSNNEVFELKGSSQTIGRNPFSEVFIDSSLLSRQHASLHVRDNELIIEDLGSKNGTYVNNMPIESNTSLMHGDVITVGDEKLMVIAPDKNDGATVFSLNIGAELGHAPVQAANNQTAIKTSEPAFSFSSSELPVYDIQTIQQIVNELEISADDAVALLIATESQETFLLPRSVKSGNEWKIGRQQFVDVKIDHPTISNLHAKIRFEDGQWFIEDTESTNGTKLNGKRTVKADLKHSDLVGLGKSNFWFVELAD